MWALPSLATHSSELLTSNPISMIESVIGNLLCFFLLSLSNLIFTSILTFIRENVFETTLIHLTERFNGKQVYLVGSMNQSTMLAQRTKKLIEELKPDVVLVQTNPR